MMAQESNTQTNATDPEAKGQNGLRSTRPLPGHIASETAHQNRDSRRATPALPKAVRSSRRRQHLAQHPGIDAAVHTHNPVRLSDLDRSVRRHRLDPHRRESRGLPFRAQPSARMAPSPRGQQVRPNPEPFSYLVDRGARLKARRHDLGSSLLRPVPALRRRARRQILSVTIHHRRSPLHDHNGRARELLNADISNQMPRADVHALSFCSTKITV